MLLRDVCNLIMRAAVLRAAVYVKTTHLTFPMYTAPNIFHGAITALKLHYRQNCLHICLATFDARRLFANRFRRVFAGRRVNRELCISDTTSCNVASQRTWRQIGLQLFFQIVYRVFHLHKLLASTFFHTDERFPS